MDTFIIVDVVKCRAQVSHHKCLWGKNRGRSGRGSVNRKEGVNHEELAADFFFLNVEETSDVLNHLLMGESQLIASGTIWRRRGNKVRGVASAIHG